MKNTLFTSLSWARRLAFTSLSFLGMISFLGAANYNLQVDYSYTNNPHGVWSYGAKTNITSPLVLCTLPATVTDDLGKPIKVWKIIPGNDPSILYNPNSTDVVSEFGVTRIPPGTVWMAPGPTSTPYAYVAIRFTVPTNGGGDYLIQTAVKPGFDGSHAGDLDLRVVKSGVEVFTQFLPPHASGGYTNVLALSPGETVDFQLGYGADGVYGGSVMRIQTLISCVTNYVFAPAIVGQSSNQTAYAGGNVHLQVQASGSQPLVYQWYYNHSVLNQETNASLVLTAVQTNQAGTYLVVVSNSVGSVTSAPISLSVALPPPPYNGYDLQRDFSFTTNPNGVWTYGTKTNITAPLILCALPATVPDDLGKPIKVWKIIPGNDPSILYNPNSTDVVSEFGVTRIPPSTVWMAPGSPSTPYAYVAIRFTVPTNGGGDYLIQTAVKPGFDGSHAGDLDLRVVKSGVEVFTQFLSPHASGGYTNVLALSPGETVDFQLGYGADGAYGGSVMRIQSLISCVTNYAFAPAIVGQSSNQTAYVGGNVHLQVQASGSQPLAYQWYYNNGVLTDQTNATLLLAVVQTNQVGNYLVVVSNSVGSTTSAPIALSVEVPPAPFNGYDLQRDFSFTTNPNGVWSYGTKTNITAPLILCNLPATVTDDVGQPIKVWKIILGNDPSILFNANTTDIVCEYGKTKIAPKTVWMAPGPHNTPYAYVAVRFTVPPDGGGDYLIQSAVKPGFDGSNAGDLDLRVIKTGVPVFTQFLLPHASGGYTNVLALAPGDTVDFQLGYGADGQYPGSVMRLQALISCVTNYAFSPVIVGLTSNQSVYAGSNLTLQVQAMGSQPLAYQWYFDNTNIPEGTNANLILNGIRTNQAGSYVVVVSNLVGTVTSTPIVLKVEVPPAPFNGYDLQRDFSPSANPTGVWSYGTKTNVTGPFILCNLPATVSDDWGQPIQTWKIIAGNDPSILYNGNATDVVCEYGKTRIAPKTVWFSPGPPSTPYSYVAVRFTVPLNGGGDYLIQSTARPGFDGPCAGDLDLRIIKSGVEIFTQFLAVHASGGYTNVMSLVPGDTLDFQLGYGEDKKYDGSVMRIQAFISCVTNYVIAPAIVSQSSNQLVYAGSNVILQVWASGSDPLTYQWYFNDGLLNGATNHDLVLAPVDVTNAGSYVVIASNILGVATSAPINLSVRVPNQEPPVITQQPLSRSVSVGSDVTFVVVSTGSAPLMYQWHYNGIVINDATNATLTLTNCQLSLGGTYSVVVTNQFGQATSAGAVLNVDNYLGGTLVFANFSGTNRAWVYDVDGVTKLEGPQYLAQLYAGPDTLTMQPIGAAVPFRTGYFAGLFIGGTRYINTVSQGAVATAQVKAWAAASGGTYEMAVAVGGKAGASEIFTAKTGGFMMPPLQMVGLRSFSLQNSITPPPPPAVSQTLQNREVVLPQVSSLYAFTNGTVRLEATGEAGMTYQIQVSDDLRTWTTYTNMVNYEGAVQILDTVRTSGGHFYRIQIVE